MGRPDGWERLTAEQEQEILDALFGFVDRWGVGFVGDWFDQGGQRVEFLATASGAKVTRRRGPNDE